VDALSGYATTVIGEPGLVDHPHTEGKRRVNVGQRICRL